MSYTGHFFSEIVQLCLLIAFTLVLPVMSKSHPCCVSFRAQTYLVESAVSSLVGWKLKVSVLSLGVVRRREDIKEGGRTLSNKPDLMKVV